jgi:hypothetical protein
MYLVKATRTTHKGIAHRLIKMSRENQYAIQAWWRNPLFGYDGWIVVGWFDELNDAIRTWNNLMK